MSHMSLNYLCGDSNGITDIKTKYVHEGQYVAEVDVELLEDETGWTPYLSVEDAHKLDDVRAALRCRDLELASKYGRIYELRAVAQ